MSSIDASGAGVWYGDSIRSAGGSLSPAVRLDWSRATLSAFGSVSQLGAGTSVQGGLAPSVFTPSVGPFALEGAGSAGGSTHQDGTRTMQATGVVRLHAMLQGRGAWIGGGTGQTWDGQTWRAIREGDFGAWLSSRDVTVLATASPVSVDDTIHYSDFQIAARYPVGIFELGASAGARTGSAGLVAGASTRRWGSVTAVAWMTQQVALVGGAGTYPVDLTQGYPGGRFVSLALRFASRGSRPGSATAPAAVNDIAGTAATAFGVHAAARAGDYVIRVGAAGARSVEIMGDFTQWRPVSLVKAGEGAWIVTLPIEHGTHQCNIRVDGGPWAVPPGLLAATDEFGGSIGIVSIE